MLLMMQRNVRQPCGEREKTLVLYEKILYDEVNGILLEPDTKNTENMGSMEIRM